MGRLDDLDLLRLAGHARPVAPPLDHRVEPERRDQGAGPAEREPLVDRLQRVGQEPAVLLALDGEVHRVALAAVLLVRLPLHDRHAHDLAARTARTYTPHAPDTHSSNAPACSSASCIPRASTCTDASTFSRASYARRLSRSIACSARPIVRQRQPIPNRAAVSARTMPSSALNLRSSVSSRESTHWAMIFASRLKTTCMTSCSRTRSSYSRIAMCGSPSLQSTHASSRSSSSSSSVSSTTQHSIPGTSMKNGISGAARSVVT